MNIIVFGATGMIGQGVLRECLSAPDVERVLCVGRHATGVQHAKLSELVHENLTDYSSVASQFEGYDACFFCLGVSSAGLSEDEYRRVTVDIAVAAAQALVECCPKMTFIFVSGAGTDSTQTSRTMWARVKGEAENAVLSLPFACKAAFRPAFVQPEHGIRSRTRAYRLGYALARPLLPLLKAAFPRYVTTTSQVGQAMLNVARHGTPNAVLENEDIIRAAQPPEAATAG